MPGSQVKRLLTAEDAMIWQSKIHRHGRFTDKQKGEKEEITYMIHYYEGSNIT